MLDILYVLGEFLFPVICLLQGWSKWLLFSVLFLVCWRANQRKSTKAERNTLSWIPGDRIKDNHANTCLCHGQLTYAL